MEDSTRVLLARLGGYECHPRTEVVHEFYGRKTPVMVQKKRRLAVSELVKSRKLVTVS